MCRRTLEELNVRRVAHHRIYVFFELRVRIGLGNEMIHTSTTHPT
jgi:hypothetical protein